MKKKLIKKDIQNIQQNITAITDNDALPPQLMKELEDKLPDWVKELEADASSVIRWNFEFAILIEYLLQRDFNFSEEEIDKLNKHLKEILPVVHKMKVEIPRLLSKQDFHLARENVERNKFLYKAEKAGIVLPNPQDTKKLK